MADYIAPEYIRARTALLDALDALGDHRRSAILVGAQAIYLHTGHADFAVSPFTYDADIALNPDELADQPLLIEVMLAAGFHQTKEPGIYKRDDGSQVDLLVPDAVGGGGRRGARLGSHTNRAAKKVRGIEGALIDYVTYRITSFDERDTRFFDIKIAGPGALLVAKLHKVADRNEGSPLRQDDKDALDVYRLLLSTTETEDLAEPIRKLLSQRVSKEVTNEALIYLRRDFSEYSGTGTRMVMRALEGIEDTEIRARSCVQLSNDLLIALTQQSGH